MNRPRVSNDNPYAESIFRTCKYRPNFPSKGFKNLEEPRKWVLAFELWYNNKHKHSGINYLTPIQRHSGNSDEILQKRKEVYEQAKLKHPNRWSRDTRNWDLDDTVCLNPERVEVIREVQINKPS